MRSLPVAKRLHSQDTVCIMEQQSSPAHHHLNLNLAGARLDSLEAGRDTRQKQHYAGQHCALAAPGPLSCRILATGEPGFGQCGAHFPTRVSPGEEPPQFFRCRTDCAKEMLDQNGFHQYGLDQALPRSTGWVGGASACEKY